MTSSIIWKVLGTPVQKGQQFARPDLAGEPPAIQKNFYKFLLGIRPNLQAVAVLLALLSIPLTYAVLHIPKIVIDDGIKDEGFPR